MNKIVLEVYNSLLIEEIVIGKDFIEMVYNDKNYDSDCISFIQVRNMIDSRNLIDEYSHDPCLTEEFILELHTELMKDNFTAVSGSYRIANVYTYHNNQKLNYMDCAEVENAMSKLISDYNNSNKGLYDISKLMIDFGFIHPFGDGNGRLQRLLMNWALLSNTHGAVSIYIPIEDKIEYIDYLYDMDYKGLENYLDFKIKEQKK